jgi:hypothetical protein
MEDNFEDLGQLIDELGTLVCSLDLPIGDKIHVEMLKEILPEKVKRLKEVFIKIAG